MSQVSAKKALICRITGQDGSYLARISIKEGVASTYEWYRAHVAASVAG